MLLAVAEIVCFVQKQAFEIVYFVHLVSWMLYIPIYLPPMNLPLYALWCLADVAGLVAEDDEPDRPFTMQTQVV